MIHTGERYINPLTDFGFKRIFGSPFNKELLISFLNAILDGERVVKDVTFNNSEKFGTNEASRRAVFDVYCTTNDGGRCIVEMQNVYQDFYKDRSIYYSTFAITDQAKRGDWNYELNDVYTIGILNFAFPEDKDKGYDNEVIKKVQLTDVKSGDIFYDKLTYFYVMLTNFNKSLEDCDTIIDKWLFCLRNLQNLLERPTALQGRVFERLFHTAEIAKFSPNERREYELSINAYRDIKNGMESAKKEGLEKGIAIGTEKGIAIGTEKIAKKLKQMGMSGADIAKATGLTKEEIDKIEDNSYN